MNIILEDVDFLVGFLLLIKLLLHLFILLLFEKVLLMQSLHVRFLTHGSLRICVLLVGHVK